jgi:hypothetical protein
VIGLLVTSWYDYKRLYRLSPELIAYISEVTDKRLAMAHPRTTVPS